MAAIAKFSVEWVQWLSESGVLKAGAPKLAPEQLKRFYEQMVLARLVDEKALALQRQGRMGTYASVRGQEAAQVGSASALSADDWLFPAFRETTALIVRGVPLELILQYWAGDERGSAMPGNNFPVAIPVGSQIPHATGVAMALKAQKKKAASIVYFGDGATSEGDFHEALNFAGVFQAPVVFLCQNNHWAISVPVGKQTAAETLAQKAIAYGIAGVRVDGNDVIAMHAATAEALERARAGKGPTLIEAFTYRMGDHTTSDDAKRYRPAGEVEAWAKKDPIARLQKLLEKMGLWSAKWEEQLRAEAGAKVEEAVRKLESVALPPTTDMFDYVYGELSERLKEQRAQV